MYSRQEQRQKTVSMNLAGMIHIPDGGSFYYDRYTHIVWLCKTRYSMMPYIGPHGHYCKYNPDTKIMSEIMKTEK